MKLLNSIDPVDIPNAMLIIDPETFTILDGNKHARDLFGFSVEGITGLDCRTVLCDGSISCPLREKNPGEFFPCEIIPKKSGKDLFVIKSFYEVVLEGKRFVIESIFDMNLLKKTEKDLLNQAQLLKGICENATMGMVLLDMNGNFFQVNSAFCEMLQYSEEELLSRMVTVTHPDDQESSDYILSQLKSGKIKKNVMEKRYVRKDGQVIFVLNSLSIMHDYDGEPLYFIIQTQDITYLKKAILKANESDKLKTHFLQNLSHEVRTPANAIFGFWELLKTPSIDESEKNEYMMYIQDGIHQFMKIINDVVDISKIETKQLEVKLSAFNVKNLLSELHIEYHRKHRELLTGAVVFTLFSSFLSIDIELTSDRSRVKQILEYLLDNAFKFTTFGHITLGCHLLPEKEIIFFVKDSGIGISNEKLDLIFEKFRQGDESSTRKYGGLGLGLAISHEIAKLIGAKLWLTSELGKGTSAFLSLPFRVSTKGKETQDYNFLDLTGITILIAEDVDANFMVLDRFFSKCNAKILRANNGLEAIEICRKGEQIDLILMDVRMPIINGYEATREILRIKPGLPIIAQTAYSLDFDEQNAFKAGCVAYMVKPLNMRELLLMIHKFINFPK